MCGVTAAFGLLIPDGITGRVVPGARGVHIVSGWSELRAGCPVETGVLSSGGGVDRYRLNSESDPMVANGAIGGDSEVYSEEIPRGGDSTVSPVEIGGGIRSGVLRGIPDKWRVFILACES